MTRQSFTFVVLTYNHEAYILEHLESIKYQIEKFGENINIELIIADDGSKDETVNLARYWIAKNNHLFSAVKILHDGINRGTCLNFVDSWKEISSDLFKVTAGDDLYSSNNIFEFIEKNQNHHIFSGVPLVLIDKSIQFPKKMIFNICASSIIYQNNFRKRQRLLSDINTPSLAYSKSILNLPGLGKFIKGYRVVEDFPMHVRVSELVTPLSFYQSSEVYVYYRRTSGSTYLVRNNEFLSDKERVYRYIASNEKSSINKFLIWNRIKCLYIKNKYARSLLNLNFVIYGFSAMKNIASILKKYRSVNCRIEKYQEHYNLIAALSMEGREDYQKSKAPPHAINDVII